MTQGQFVKRSKVCFNSEFSFSLTGCLIEDKETSVHYFLFKVERRKDGFMPLQKTNVKRNTYSFTHDLNSGL